MGNLHETETAIGNAHAEPINNDQGTKQEKKQQQGDAIQKQLARKFIRYGYQQPQWLNIHYWMGKSGQKFMQFRKVGAPN